MTATHSQALILGGFAGALMLLIAVAGELALEGPAVAALGVAGFALTALLLGAANRRHERLRRMAATDALTGLVNHGGFHDVLSRQLDSAARLGIPVALVTIDLDDFKKINDTRGHPYGDEVLRGIGGALQAVSRDSDTAARLGGEEFALILPGVDDAGAYAIAERARAAIAAIPVEGFELTCSAGIASYPADAADADTLCRLADGALYWAKRAGKRRTRRFDPGHAPTTWSTRQAEEIAALLELEGPIRSVYQPIVSLASGRITGYEALARFPSAPGRSPSVWFAQAHGCGLGPELEAIAIRAALDPFDRPPGTTLAINVSPSALFSEAVQKVLPADLTDLVLEITEHEFVPDDEELAAAVGELRERGALIAIDDAGAGHAGLKQLMRVRPDIVKLDGALVDGIHADPARIALTESFVRFARDVGATVCAEGIETLDDLAVLADLDVEWGQGFALCHPAPPWGEVSEVAVAVCRGALAEACRTMPVERHPVGTSDRRLVHVSAGLAGARSREDLEGALALIAEELHASKVCLSRYLPHTRTLETLAENGEVSGETHFQVHDYPLSARVLENQEAVQLTIGDPDADPAETELLLTLGERSLLMVPVVCRGESLGIIEAYRTSEQPWARAEINRARVISNQFASVLQALGEVREQPASAA